MSWHKLARQAWASPWKARNELERLALWPLAWASLLAQGIQIGPGWHFYGLPIWQIQRPSTVQIGARCHLRSTRRSNPLGVAHPCVISTRQEGAMLIIGDDFGMTGGVIVCAEYIQIGARVMVGAGAVISDTDFHPLDPLERRRDPANGRSAPIRIGDDVFVGMRALILKGVTLNTGCVVGAGSVVTRDVPPRAVVAGNPARLVRTL
ncbi:MAG: acyltransferase [Anaerolineae bacterium]|nr:acyltransferase [Anaerolineae bacterium]